MARLEESGLAGTEHSFQERLQPVLVGVSELARPAPLTDVEQAWADAARTVQRIVMTPQRSLDTRA